MAGFDVYWENFDPMIGAEYIIDFDSLENAAALTNTTGSINATNSTNVAESTDVLGAGDGQITMPDSNSANSNSSLLNPTPSPQSRHATRWTDEELSQAVMCCLRGMSNYEISEQLERPERVTRIKLTTLAQYWKEEQDEPRLWNHLYQGGKRRSNFPKHEGDEDLKRYHAQGYTDAELKRALGWRLGLHAALRRELLGLEENKVSR